MNAHRFVTSDEKTTVEQAIAEAEKSTSAEIVCAIATESGRYDRAEAVVGMLGALLGLALVNGTLAPGSGDWGALSVPFVWQVGGAVAGFLAGTIAASYTHGLRRILVRRQEMDEETARAASHVFARRRLSSTRGRAGVLLYLSLFERRLVVLADKGAFDVIGQEGIDALRDLALGKLQSGDASGTLVETVRAAAQKLAGALPRDEEDQDELSNELLIYHPRP